MLSTWIGPVGLDDFVEPQLTWTGSPTALGLQSAQVTAMAEWGQVHQLRELADNPHRRVTIGGQSGVLEPIYFPDSTLGPLTAWCLLQSCQLGQADQSHSLQGRTGLVPYTLNLAAIGHGTHRQVVAVRSARGKSNDFSLTPQALVVNPFWDEDQAGSGFIVDPGGTRFSREYDASFPHATAGTPEPRHVTLYAAPLAGDVDQLALVTLPRLADAFGGPPGWVTDRGGDARAYNRREMRDVFGPSHRVEVTTDLMLVNGLCRFWVGNRGLRPFLQCQSFSSGAWREPGTVQFANDVDELVGVRIVRLTFEEITIALTVLGHGDILVTLRRGETLLRCSQPAGLPLPIWSGVPPTSRARSARIAPAHFDKGIIGGSDIEDASWAAPFSTWAGDDFHNWDGSPYMPDLRLRWPPDVKPSAWSRVWRIRPTRALTALGTVGLLTIYSEQGVAEVEAYVDTDLKAKVRVADTVVVTSGVLSFAANDDIVIGLGYDGTTLTLSWRTNAGAITYTSAAVSITAAAFYDEGYFVNFARWGDGSWGDGSWGGTTHYSSSVIDNDMLFEGKLTNAEFATLCTASASLGNLPVEEGRLRRYAPFDVLPLVSMSQPLNGGRSVEVTPDEWGQQKVLAALKEDFTEMAVFLVKSGLGNSAEEQHAQAAAQNEQQVRVR